MPQPIRESVIAATFRRYKFVLSKMGMTYGRGESDRPIVPTSPSNKGGEEPTAERAEGRGLAKENSLRQNQSIGLRAAPDWQSALGRIRKAARGSKQMRFTALWHHVCDVRRLREEYFALTRDSAPGVDGQTWEQYGRNLEANLQDLSGRLHRGACHAKPVRRAWIPKPDGRQRPIGVPVVEDKIVQRAATKVLSAVYEADFMGFFVWFPAGQESAQCVGRPVGRDHHAEGELGAGRGHPRVFGSRVILHSCSCKVFEEGRTGV